MKGKVCLITGANSGIGFAASMELASMGASLVLVCRDKAKGEAALKAIQERTGNRSVELMVADLSSMDQVRAVAGAFRSTYHKLDVLINNAGVLHGRRVLTQDSYEATFATNHLAPFLLTHLLMDRLKTAAPSRVVGVASIAEKSGRIDMDNLQGERRYRGFENYCHSKLANVLFTLELARRLKGTGVTANCLHPGVVATHLGQTQFGPLALFIKAIKPFFISPEKGAQTTVYLASAPELTEVSGKYFENMAVKEPSPLSQREELARELWQASAHLTGLPDIPTFTA